VSAQDQIQAFVAFSAAVTGFDEVDLHGTGQPEEYRSTVAEAVGEEILAELLEAWTRVSGEAAGDEARLASLLRRDVFSDPKLGPVARNIVKLWYVGIWYELPPAWINAFGALEKNYTFMVSGSAYVSGMLWPTVGGNPPGARGPGYGSWAGPPQLGGSTPRAN
jgi:hypothetical protein